LLRKNVSSRALRAAQTLASAFTGNPAALDDPARAATLDDSMEPLLEEYAYRACGHTDASEKLGELAEDAPARSRSGQSLDRVGRWYHRRRRLPSNSSASMWRAAWEYDPRGVVAEALCSWWEDQPQPK